MAVDGVKIESDEGRRWLLVLEVEDLDDLRGAALSTSPTGGYQLRLALVDDAAEELVGAVRPIREHLAERDDARRDYELMRRDPSMRDDASEDERGERMAEAAAYAGDLQRKAEKESR